MTRTAVVWTIVAVVVVAVGAAGLFAGLSHGHAHPATAASAPAASAPATASSRLTATSQAQDAAEALQRLATDPGSLLPSDQTATVDVGTAVPKASSVTPHPRTWTSTGPDSGTMSVTLASPGLPTETYLVAMAQENGGWKVLSTIQAGNG